VFDPFVFLGHEGEMPALNISKVAVACASLDALRRRQQARMQNGIVPLRTRYKPKRADELIGGSVYWIIRHRIAARQVILGFEEDSAERKTIICVEPELVLVHPQPRRAHQGWRYLAGTDAPADWGAPDDGTIELPATLAEHLTELALI
jgi:hypothetical protein